MDSSNKTQKKKLFKLVFHGLRHSGKTSLLYALKHGDVMTSIPMIPNDFEKITVAGIDTVFWDNGGRSIRRVLFQSHYRNASGFVYVIDSDNKEDLDESIDELNRSIFQKEETQNTVIMVLVNKQDIATALPVETIEERVREKVSLNLNGPAHGGRYVLVRGCSATTKEGLFEAFSEFIEQVVLKESEKIDSTTKETDNKKKSKIQAMTGKIGSHFHALKKMFGIPFFKSVLLY